MKSSLLRLRLILPAFLALVPVLFILSLPTSVGAQDVVVEVSFAGTAMTTEVPQLTSTSATVIAALIQNSLDAADQYDVVSPPSATAAFYLQTSFLVGTAAYVRDARPPGASSSFTMASRLIGGPATVTLTWNLSRLPAGYSAQLTDAQANQAVDLRAQPAYSYLSPANTSRNLTILLKAPAPSPTASPTPTPTPFVFAPAPIEPAKPLQTPRQTPRPAPAPKQPEESQELPSAIILVVSVIGAATYVFLKLKQRPV